MPKNVRSGAARAVKTTLNLPADSSELLRTLADQRGTTLAEVIRRALQLEEYLTKVRKGGGRILVEDGEKSVTEVLIF